MWRPSVTVLTLAGGGISRISGFLDANLFAPFGLAPAHGEQLDAEATA